MGEQECAIKVTNRKQGVLQNFEFSNFFCYELKCTSPSGSSMSSILFLKLENNTKMQHRDCFAVSSLPMRKQVGRKEEKEMVGNKENTGGRKKKKSQKKPPF